MILFSCRIPTNGDCCCQPLSCKPFLNGQEVYSSAKIVVFGMMSRLSSGWAGAASSSQALWSSYIASFLLPYLNGNINGVVGKLKSLFALMVHALLTDG